MSEYNPAAEQLHYAEKDIVELNSLVRLAIDELLKAGRPVEALAIQQEFNRINDIQPIEGNIDDLPFI